MCHTQMKSLIYVSNNEVFFFKESRITVDCVKLSLTSIGSDGYLIKVWQLTIE